MNSSNPTEVAKKLINESPILKNILSVINSSGMSFKDFFYQYANSQGVDPDHFINSLLKEN